jgi:hypothetical protein
MLLDDEILRGAGSLYVDFAIPALDAVILL